MTPTPLNRNLRTPKAWSSPPARTQPKSQQVCQQPKESTVFSAAQSKPDRALMSRSKLGLLAMGCLAVGLGATASAPTSAAQAQEVQAESYCADSVCEEEEVILHEDQDWGVLSFQLVRQQDGDVVVQFGKDDTVVNPAENSIYELPGAAHRATYQLGESLCEQAADLGGECVTKSLAFIPNGEHGVLQVEQTGGETIVAGPMELSFEEHGVKVGKPGRDAFFPYQAGTNHFSNW